MILYNFIVYIKIFVFVWISTILNAKRLFKNTSRYYALLCHQATEVSSLHGTVFLWKTERLIFWHTDSSRKKACPNVGWKVGKSHPIRHSLHNTPEITTQLRQHNSQKVGGVEAATDHQDKEAHIFTNTYCICAYYNRDSHTISKCRNRKQDESRAKEKRETPTTSSDRTEDGGFMSYETCFMARSPNDWFADSGSTQHMSDQRHFLNNFIPVNGSSWFVGGIGGSRLKVCGHGEVNFPT